VEDDLSGIETDGVDCRVVATETFMKISNGSRITVALWSTGIPLISADDQREPIRSSGQPARH